MNQIITPSEAKQKGKSSTRAELISAAAEARLLDVAGNPDVSRAMALVADKRLKLGISERSLKKQLAGIPSAPKGMMLQINKRIMTGLGASVTANKDDEDIQEIVALIRSACERALRKDDVDYFSKDWEQQDKAAKARIYAIIDRMVAAYRSAQ